MQRYIRVIAATLAALIVIGLICYSNVSIVDAISGASAKPQGLTEYGALYFLIHGVSR